MNATCVNCGGPVTATAGQKFSVQPPTCGDCFALLHPRPDAVALTPQEARRALADARARQQERARSEVVGGDLLDALAAAGIVLARKTTP